MNKEKGLQVNKHLKQLKQICIELAEKQAQMKVQDVRFSLGPKKIHIEYNLNRGRQALRDLNGLVVNEQKKLNILYEDLPELKEIDKEEYFLWI